MPMVKFKLYLMEEVGVEVELGVEEDEEVTTGPGENFQDQSQI